MGFLTVNPHTHKKNVFNSTNHIYGQFFQVICYQRMCHSRYILGQELPEG